MRKNSNTFTLFFVAVVGALSSACQSGGVGDPCIPEDEYALDFPGYQATEVNVESQSFQCETRVCLVANFRGRVSCPYGQADPKISPADPEHSCYLPGFSGHEPNASQYQVQVPVDAWIKTAAGIPNGRQPDQAVYCSCRCDGPDKAARYCQCPSGFICQKLVEDIGKGKAQLAGSYCIKEGSQITDPTALKAAGTPCSQTPTPLCGPPHPAAPAQ